MAVETWGGKGVLDLKIPCERTYNCVLKISSFCCGAGSDRAAGVGVSLGTLDLRTASARTVVLVMRLTDDD